MTERQAGRPKNDAMSGEELRKRIDALGWSYVDAADQLGLSVPGLHKQMRSVTGVSRQTALLLQLREQMRNAAGAKRRSGLRKLSDVV
jgi:hypothetical protein